ncbi:ORF2 protein [Lentinula edodes negative-strand RNA virus 1]|uniref:ORF2 protein n=1 Tax=Lentinula edodes negative-strand RNA virus 1 TaxID=2547430 RepID=A0A4P2VSJ6_9MONO|nr:ORF2 protein [Lentinula edodes negative-strand RNA virus 1]BBI93112.1 ORF2 protein [Lentinula edodes negative-strand RNA virus 1]
MSSTLVLGEPKIDPAVLKQQEAMKKLPMSMRQVAMKGDSFQDQQVEESIGMANAALAPATGHQITLIPFHATSLADAPKIWTPPGSALLRDNDTKTYRDQVVAMGRVLMAICCSQGPEWDDRRVTATQTLGWRSLILTFLSLIIPYEELPREMVPIRSVVPTTEWHNLASTFVNLLQKSADASPVQKEVDDLRDVVNAELSALGLPAMGPLTMEAAGAVATSTSLDEVAQYFGLILVHCGRVQDKKACAGSLLRRGQALSRKYYSTSSHILLTGEGRVSVGASKLLKAAFEYSVDFRAHVLLAVAHLSQGRGGRFGDIITTISKMMAYTNMAHAEIVISFLARRKWCARMPTLRTEINYNNASWKQLMIYPPLQRPYVKAILGDQFPAFNTKNLHGLISLAVFDESKTSDTIKGYALHDPPAHILAEYQLGLDAFGENIEATGSSGDAPAVGTAAAPVVQTE